MTYDRRPYDDADTTGQMTLDAAACSARLVLPRQRALSGVPSAADVRRPAPRLTHDAWVESPKREIEVSEAAAHLAARLHLHLD
ncbi:hypothetical protein [Nocardioides marmoraquaticus]